MTATTRPAPAPAAAAVARGAVVPERLIEAPPRPRHLEVVPPGARSPRAQRRRARLLASAAVAVVVAAVFGLVAFHVVLTQGQLQLDQLQGRATNAQATYDRLRLQVAELEAPERVVAEAQQRLGMVPPPGVTYLSPSGAAVTPAPTDDEAASAEGEPTGTSWPTVKAHLVRP